VRLEEIDNLVALTLQIWIHLPDRCEAMQVLGVMLAEEVHDEMDAILRLLLPDFLGQSGEELVHRVAGTISTARLPGLQLHLASTGLILLVADWHTRPSCAIQIHAARCAWRLPAEELTVD